MSVRKNFQEMNQWLEQLVIPGTIAAGADQAAVLAPFDGVIRRIQAKLSNAGVQGGGGSDPVDVDVNKNGTSLFGGSLAQWDGSSVDPTYSAGVTGEIAVLEGDVISADVVTVFDGSGPNQPENMMIAIMFQRTPRNNIQSGNIDAKDR